MALLSVAFGGLLTVEPAEAAGGAVIDSADCMQNELPANDDSYSSEVQLPFGVDYYGNSFESLWVNNNGNVTFDVPLSTYTPFGLANTSTQIIAPFFADVDTRGAGSDTVRYGWGTTTYEGQRAFCVNWIDVGYYSGGTDKLNSFQLLLVNREDASSPGAFDIIFNYDKIQWETGSASGGSGGLGGTSAVAGFSNGSGRDGSSFELSGSSVNGAFLDSSSTGLATTSTDSTVTGRHVFRVRGGTAPLTQYVALGDSFQSGEGAGAYLPNTDIPGNICHRSAYAYPKRLVDDGVVNLNLDFGACSGAVIDDLAVSYDPGRPPYTDGIAQLDRLSSSTKLVTLGIGGNDMGFADVLKGCITAQIGDALNPFVDAACEPEYGDRVDASLEAMIDQDKLSTIYKEVRQRAPFARVLVLGYPRFYVEGGAHNSHHDDYCAGMRMTDQRWINREIRQFNSVISNSARSLGLQYIDIYDTPDGHELCGASSERFLNGVDIVDATASYHPNEYGHELIAQDVTVALRTPSPGTLFNVHPGETIEHSFESAGGDLDVSTQWPGSDVVLSLTTPSGRRIGRETVAVDLSHEVGPTFEGYHIANAETGRWTATLFGANVAPQGEETRLDVWQTPSPNLDPIAKMSLNATGRSVTLDAGASTDVDGTVVDYLWEFGDGSVATGLHVSHTYTTAGRYLVTLAIRDDTGGEAFVSADQLVEIPEYEFSGFRSPVDAAPVVNDLKAGRAVPIKFSLGGDFGVDFLAAGSPSSLAADCDTSVAVSAAEPAAAAGHSLLTYDVSSETYTYVWKTLSSWSGTCRTFQLALDDGSINVAHFRFR